MLKICYTCGKEFKAKRSSRSCCSRICGNRMRSIKRTVDKVCQKCGKTYQVKLCRSNKTLGCSRECAHWKKDVIKDAQGYLRVIGGHGKKDFKRIFQHRVIVEDILGRKLKKVEVVHHIDGNRVNNETSNLFLFRLRSAHTRYHAFLRRHGLVGGLVSNLELYGAEK